MLINNVRTPVNRLHAETEYRFTWGQFLAKWVVLYTLMRARGHSAKK